MKKLYNPFELISIYVNASVLDRQRLLDDLPAINVVERRSDVDAEETGISQEDPASCYPAD